MSAGLAVWLGYCAGVLVTLAVLWWAQNRPDFKDEPDASATVACAVLWPLFVGVLVISRVLDRQPPAPPQDYP